MNRFDTFLNWLEEVAKRLERLELLITKIGIGASSLVLIVLIVGFAILRRLEDILPMMTRSFGA